MESVQIEVKTTGTGEYQEKKSRFIGQIHPVYSEEQATAIIENTRKKYWDAKHNCYAYVLGDKDQIVKASDDGEPSQTAGKPILDLIQIHNIHNCIVIVTRYFGGTLLGTGGLVRAYSKAAKDAIDNCQLVEIVEGVSCQIIVDYTLIGKIQYILELENAEIVSTEYGEKVVFTVNIKKSLCDHLTDSIVKVSCGQAKIQSTPGIKLKYPYTL